MKKSKKIILYILIAGVVFVIIGFSALLFSYSNSPLDKNNTPVLIDIPTGSSFLTVTEILNQEGLIKSRFLFYSLVIMKNAKQHIRAGEYYFNTSMTPSSMIDKLLRGEDKRYVVWIPEDSSVREIAARLDSMKLINKKEFLKLAKDKEFLEALNIKADSIEGYLFPDTYVFKRSMTTRQIMKIMVNRFGERVTPEMIKRSEGFGFNINRFVTLASIIGKESDDDKYKISNVFHYRLKKNIPLQSSSSAVYDLENFNGKILNSHLKRKSPYNTFIIHGLPPGPIANPGLTSLRAALYPAKAQISTLEEKKSLLELTEKQKSDCHYACKSSGNTQTEESLRIMKECLLSCDEVAKTEEKEIEKMK